MPAEPAATAGGVPIDNLVLAKHRLAVDRKIDRNAVLVAIGRRLPKKPAERREALKRLVAERILLQTGVINIEHPAVAGWIITDRKKTDRHG